jgi:small GTP-binding protein
MADSKAIVRYKVVVIGATNTGKTSLIRRYRYNEFLSAHFTTSTPGVEFVRPDPSAPFELGVWDTAGHEDWQSMNSSVYHGAHAIVFVGAFDSVDSLTDIVTK